MEAMDCKWQTAEAVMTGSLKYATEDIAVLATLRWKWQGQQLARNGRLVWIEREMTWNSTHNLICSQSKNVVCIRNSQCRYCSVFAVLWAFGSRLMFSFHRKSIVPLQTIKHMKLVINEHGHRTALIQQLLVSLHTAFLDYCSFRPSLPWFLEECSEMQLRFLSKAVFSPQLATTSSLWQTWTYFPNSVPDCLHMKTVYYFNLLLYINDFIIIIIIMVIFLNDTHYIQTALHGTAWLKMDMVG